MCVLSLPQTLRVLGRVIYPQIIPIPQILLERMEKGKKISEWHPLFSTGSKVGHGETNFFQTAKNGR